MPALFEDIFDVTDRDPDGKKFDRGALREVMPDVWPPIQPVLPELNRTPASLDSRHVAVRWLLHFMGCDRGSLILPAVLHRRHWQRMSRQLPLKLMHRHHMRCMLSRTRKVRTQQLACLLRSCARAHPRCCAAAGIAPRMSSVCSDVHHRMLL